jgi:hypothetical protein
MTRPYAGWREMGLFWYRSENSEWRSVLSAASRPFVAWSVDGQTDLVELREPVAQCRPLGSNELAPHLAITHRSPHEMCQCGFAANYSPGLPLKWTPKASTPYRRDLATSKNIAGGTPAIDGPQIPALVWAWGTVILHDSNLRSEYMAVAALVKAGGWKDDVAAIHAEKMGVPLMSWEEAWEFSKMGRQLKRGE